MSVPITYQKFPLAAMARLAVLGGGFLVALLLSAASAAAAVDLSGYADFGRADILLTAASIRQSGGNPVAFIDQTTDSGGSGNIAEIEQSGPSNVAFVTQIGDLNRTRVVQSDSDNQATITQHGIGNSIDVLQSGGGNRLNGLQQGDGNMATITQSGSSNVTFSEIGNNNTLNLSDSQSASGIPVVILITGNGMTVTQR